MKYQIMMSDCRLVGDKVQRTETLLPYKYLTAEAANIDIRKFAESYVSRYYNPAKLVQHHAGESVAFLGKDLRSHYIEYWRVSVTGEDNGI